MPNEVSFRERLSESIDQNRQGFVASVELTGIGDIVGTFGLEASELIIYQTGKGLLDQMNDLSIAARTGERLFKILYITDDETENINPRLITERIYQIASDSFDLMGANVFVTVFMGGNISAEELTSPDFLKYVIKFIRRSGLRMDLLEIEITETALMKDVIVASRNLEKIRNMG